MVFFLLLNTCADAEPKQEEFPEIGKYIARFHACYNDGYCHGHVINTHFWKLSDCQNFVDNELGPAIYAYSERRGGLKEGFVQCGLVNEPGEVI